MCLLCCLGFCKHDMSNSTNQPPLVRLARVNKHFGAFQALTDIGVEIPAGQVCIVVGPPAPDSAYYAVIVALTLYNGVFIAELVRSGCDRCQRAA